MSSTPRARIGQPRRMPFRLFLLALAPACTKLDAASEIVRHFEPVKHTMDAGDHTLDDASVLSLPDASLGPPELDGASEEVADAAQGMGSSDAGAPSCIDPDGFQKLGCFRCEPVDITTLENACADVSCTPFDVRRLSKLPLGGQLPELPLPDTTDPSSGGSSGGAGVGTACNDLAAKGSLVYVTGSTAAKPFLQQIAQQLSSKGVYLIYTATGSCTGVDAVVNGTPMTSGAAPAPAASASYWDGVASAAKSCDLPAQGVLADLGISDVFAQTCPGLELVDLDAQGIRDAHGPIQTMTFVVPASSRHTEINAQAAYFVFGFGRDGGVLDELYQWPIWSDESYILQRSATSGTQAMIAAAIGVPSNLWKGRKHASSDELAAELQQAGSDPSSANKAIGVLGADYIDSRNLRAQIHMLAYQDTKQTCAVYPDSTATAHDRSNVRDGHYPIWGPMHLLYRVDGSGNPVNTTSGRSILEVIGYLSGTKALPNGIKLIDLYAQSGLVPECAMRVTRTKDGGNITPSRPDEPCSCLFEAKATGSTACKSCKVQGDCAANETCSQGYCEP